MTSGLLASLPGRYAKALFELSEAEKCTELVIKSLEQIQKTITKTAELQSALKDPTVSRKAKARILTDICEAHKVPSLLTLFLQRLALSQRLDYLPDIIELFYHQLHAQKEEQEIEVYVAYDLTKEQTQQLNKILSSAFHGKLTIHYHQDPHLLGGILIRAGSKVIDASLTTLFNRLATVMKGTA